MNAFAASPVVEGEDACVYTLMNSLIVGADAKYDRIFPGLPQFDGFPPGRLTNCFDQTSSSTLALDYPLLGSFRRVRACFCML